MCSFGNENLNAFYVQKSRHYPNGNPKLILCTGDSILLSQCTSIIDGVEEHELFQQRNGKYFDDQAFEEAKICENHRTFFGKEFRGYAGKFKTCKYADHPKNSVQKPSRGVLFKNCKSLLKQQGILLPFGFQICLGCETKIPSAPPEVEGLYPKLPENKKVLALDTVRYEEEEDLSTNEFEDSGLHFDDPRDLDFQQKEEEEEEDSSDDEESTEQAMKELKEDMRKLMKRILKCSDKENKLPRAQKPFNALDQRSRGRMKLALAYTNAYSVSCMTTIENDYMDIWKYARDSGMMEHALGGSNVSTITETLIQAFNNTIPRADKIRILSAFVKQFPKYSMISKFQPPPRSTAEEGIIQDNDDDYNDVDEPLTQEESQTLPNIGICFNQKISRRLWRQAVIHYNSFNHAMAPIAPRKRAAWKLDPQVVELILDHVFSQGVTNNVAFGTYQMKDAQGAKMYVAKTIRESHNAVIVRQLQTLIMQNFPKKNEKGEDLVPPKRTLFKILALMPATGT